MNADAMQGVRALVARVSRDGDCDPADRHHFIEALEWAFEEEWAPIHDAYHRFDDAEFGRLLGLLVYRYWVREARS